MSAGTARNPAAADPTLADGWELQRLTQPSRLYGANGLRTGPDGRIYVAELVGSQISALDVASGKLEAISPKGGDIVAPDDVAFDSSGNLYATEYYNGRVSVRAKDGRTRVVRGDLPGANGITVHADRLFVNECRPGGRLLELDLNGGSPRVLLDNLMMPNAMEVGPDGKLYFPVLALGEIWRIGLDGGAHEKVCGDLVTPDAVKFDSEGQLVVTQAATGEVARIDPRTGDKTVLAQLEPGLDNCTFVGDRLFVSSFTGQITEVLGGGQAKALLPGALQWPLDLAVGPGGELYIADGTHVFVLASDGNLQTLGMMFHPGYPSNVRGLVALRGGEFLTANTLGQVSRWRPEKMESDVLVEGLDPQLYGLSLAPGGATVVAELGAGRVVSIENGDAKELVSGLDAPMGVAHAPGGECFVSESGAGRVVKLTGSGRVDTVVDGLQQPQGLLVRQGRLYVVDAGDKALIAVDLESKVRTTIAAQLPVGAPPGVTPKPLQGVDPFTGPQGPFAGIAGGPDGTLYVSADGEGSVLSLRQVG